MPPQGDQSTETSLALLVQAQLDLHAALRPVLETAALAHQAERQRHEAQARMYSRLEALMGTRSFAAGASIGVVLVLGSGSLALLQWAGVGVDLTALAESAVRAWTGC